MCSHSSATYSELEQFEEGFNESHENQSWYIVDEEKDPTQKIYVEESFEEREAYFDIPEYIDESRATEISMKYIGTTNTLSSYPNFSTVQGVTFNRDFMEKEVVENEVSNCKIVVVPSNEQNCFQIKSDNFEVASLEQDQDQSSSSKSAENVHKIIENVLEDTLQVVQVGKEFTTKSSEDKKIVTNSISRKSNKSPKFRLNRTYQLRTEDIRKKFEVPDRIINI